MVHTCIYLSYTDTRAQINSFCGHLSWWKSPSVLFNKWILGAAIPGDAHVSTLASASHNYKSSWGFTAIFISSQACLHLCPPCCQTDILNNQTETWQEALVGAKSPHAFMWTSLLCIFIMLTSELFLSTSSAGVGFHRNFKLFWGYMSLGVEKLTFTAQSAFTYKQWLKYLTRFHCRWCS